MRNNQLGQPNPSQDISVSEAASAENAEYPRFFTHRHPHHLARHPQHPLTWRPRNRAEYSEKNLFMGVRNVLRFYLKEIRCLQITVIAPR